MIRGAGMLLIALTLGHPAPGLSAESDMFGVPLAILPDGGRDEVGSQGTSLVAGEPLLDDSNTYEGGGLDPALGRMAGIYVAGGVVELRDPLTTAESIGRPDEYWATSAGLEIRF